MGKRDADTKIAGDRADRPHIGRLKVWPSICREFVVAVIS